MAEAPARVLVIRLGALGDIVQSFGPFAAIRAHHPGARITLLTTAPFAEWLGGAAWFDAVAVDARPAWWDAAGLARLGRTLRGFDMVYDLQTSGRSTRYWWLAGCAAWSGIGWGRRYPHRDPGRDRLHTYERQRGQLANAGIAVVPALRVGDLAGLMAPVAAAGVQAPYAVLVPGASAHRPDKRWPAACYAALAGVLMARGLAIVVAGAAADRALGQVIARQAAVLDLTGATDLPALARLLADAALVVGNDTGPMHLAAALGTRCLVLFGGASDPTLTAPRMPDGAVAGVLRVADLAELAVARVAEAVR